MNEQLSIITRNTVGFLFWSAIATGSATIHVLVVFANYAGCVSAFELLGYDTKPLRLDPLLGPYIGAFFGEVTLAQLYAMVVALTVGWGLFMCFHVGFRTFELVNDRLAYVEQGDQTSANIAWRLITYNLVVLAVFAVPLTFALHWDIQLFRYRSLAGALGIENPRAAAQQLAAWDSQLQQHSDLFAWTIAKGGAWGYISVTTLACLALEFAFRKVDEVWSRLLSGFQQMYQPSAGDDDHAALPERLPANTYRESEQELAEANLPRTTLEPGDTGRADSQEDGFIPHRMSDEEMLDDEPNGAGHAPVVPRADELVEVIGGEGERVAISVALASPDRYYVDAATNEIWDRAYWEGVHDPDPDAPAET